MTTLVTHVLETTLSQDFDCELDRRLNVSGIRPYIMVHGSPAGTFTMTLKQGSESVASADFTASGIKIALGTSDNYLHAWYRLTFDTVIDLSKNTYTLELSSTGYTATETDYIGWIAEHENQINSADVDNFTQNPLSFQLWRYK